MAELVVIYDKDSGGLKAKLIGTSQIASGAVTKDKIYDGDPFTIQQTSAAMLKHLPYGYGAGPTYRPIHVDASGYMSFNAIWPDNSVTSAKIAANAIGGGHILDGSLTYAELADATLVSAKIGLLAVGTPHIADGVVTSAKIASGYSTPLADGAVTSAKIASGAVGDAHIYPGAILSAKIGANVVGTPHLEQFASGKIIVGQGTGANPILRDRWTAIEFIIDGAGLVITSGQKGHLEIPFPGIINRVTLLGDQSGYINLDIWKDTYAGFEGIAATDSICSSFKPTISSAMKYQDSALTGWNKTIVSGNILAYMVESLASNIQRCTVSLGVYR